MTVESQQAEKMVREKLTTPFDDEIKQVQRQQQDLSMKRIELVEKRRSHIAGQVCSLMGIKAELVRWQNGFIGRFEDYLAEVQKDQKQLPFVEWQQRIFTLKDALARNFVILGVMSKDVPR